MMAITLLVAAVLPHTTLLVAAVSADPRLQGLHREPAAHSRVSLILDTDMSIDVADAGMLCAAHALEDLGEAKIVAVVHDSAARAGVGAISVINDFYGREHIPIGAYTGPVGAPSQCGAPPCAGWPASPASHWTKDGRGVYIEGLVSRFPSSIKSIEQAQPALAVYRRALAGAAPHSLALVITGYLTNLLELLNSQPDEISPLSGTALLASRVTKLIMVGGRQHTSFGDPPTWTLGGCGGGCGRYDDLGTISERALSLWPPSVPIEMISQESGEGVISGASSSVLRLLFLCSVYSFPF